MGSRSRCELVHNICSMELQSTCHGDRQLMRRRDTDGRVSNLIGGIHALGLRKFPQTAGTCLARGSRLPHFRRRIPATRQVLAMSFRAY